MPKQNTHQIDPFDAICMTARRSPTRGKIGDFVAQMTTPGFANCTSPSNPRQQVRRYVKTPRPNSIRQQWIAHVLRECWQFESSSRFPQWPEVIDAGIRIGFYWNTQQQDADGRWQSFRYKAPQRGGLIRSFIREMTQEIARLEELPPIFSDIRTPRVRFPREFETYLQTVRTIPYGYSPR